jgi:class 3 adenylate cyclase
MPRLKLLATLAIEDESTFALMLRKLTELPRQLQERELDTLPQMMLVSDLLRCLREQSDRPQLSIFLEDGVAHRRGHSRLLFHLANSSAAHADADADANTNPATPLAVPAHLHDLLTQHRLEPSAASPLHNSGLVITVPLRATLLPDQMQTLITALNVPTKERLMADLELAKQKARNVLDKIFPSTVVQQLEDGASAIYDYYPSTTILFSDMVGFTSLSKDMDARELVTFIDTIFGRMDRLCDKHGVEKIKTIGDAYMAAAGVPVACEDHAARIAHLAMDFLELYQEIAIGEGTSRLNTRIGIHSGPVVGGVIGLNKFAFDLWGDTVNIASRMESTGIPGEIQMSIATRNLLPDHFVTHIRGHVAMKGHSSIETFLLRGR